MFMFSNISYNSVHRDVGVKVRVCRAEQIRGTPHHLFPWGEPRLEQFHSSSSLIKIILPLPGS